MSVNDTVKQFVEQARWFGGKGREFEGAGFRPVFDAA